MRVWIDATGHNEQIEVFGMSLLERLLCSLLDAQRQISGLESIQRHLPDVAQLRSYMAEFVARHLEPSEVRIELRPGAPIPSDIPDELLRQLPITWSTGSASLFERLREATRDADGEPLLALSADTVVDVRVLEHISWANGPLVFFESGGEAGAVALRLDDALPESMDCDPEELSSIARACLESGIVKSFAPASFGGYNARLRRTIPPYLIRVADDSAASAVERRLFESNCKGATDFVTKYLYPPLVWRALGPLTKRRVRPNTLTALGMFCCFAAVPFFAAGWWLSGLLLGYAMSLLDSIDGKLARVTFSSSKQGEVLDHGTDLVHPPIWYWAWAWGLSGGDPSSTVFLASLWLAGLYIGDRILETLFKSCTGRSVQDYTPLDVRLRTFVSRRNVNLALFTIALPLGLGVEAFYVIVGLQLATLVYHLVRVIQCWDGDGKQNASQLRPAAGEHNAALRRLEPALDAPGHSARIVES